MKSLLFVVLDAKSQPTVLKSFSRPPKVDGKTLKARETLLLQGKPCVVYDLARPAPWPEGYVVDLPIAASVLTYPVAFETTIETKTKLMKALTDFIISGPELEEESEEEEAVAATAATTTVGGGEDDYESADMEDESSQEEEEEEESEEEEDAE